MKGNFQCTYKLVKNSHTQARATPSCSGSTSTISRPSHRAAETVLILYPRETAHVGRRSGTRSISFALNAVSMRLSQPHAKTFKRAELFFAAPAVAEAGGLSQRYPQPRAMSAALGDATGR